MICHKLYSLVSFPYFWSTKNRDSFLHNRYMHTFQSLLQKHAWNLLAVMMDAARRNEIIILRGVRTQTQHENLKNCIWTSVIVPGGQCITKIICGLYWSCFEDNVSYKLYINFIGAVSRTMYHKNYIWTLLELFRGQCITNIIHGLYWSCFEDTVSQKLYMDFIGAVSRTMYHKNYTWTLLELFREHCITKIIHELYGSCFEDNVS